MTSNTPQVGRVLDALKQHREGVTTTDLMLICSTTRPANQIMTLRRQGYNIRDIWINGMNRYGKPIRYVRYQLIGEENEQA